MDVIGELFGLYSLATAVYCGGSLVAKGGQNILEPAAWGKVVFYGPSMEDFLDEKTLLEEAGAGIPVRNAEELLEGMKALLSDPAELMRRGMEGQKRVLSSRGAAERYAGMIHQGIRQQATGYRRQERQARGMNDGRSSKPSFRSGLMLAYLC